MTIYQLRVPVSPCMCPSRTHTAQHRNRSLRIINATPQEQRQPVDCKTVRLRPSATNTLATARLASSGSLCGSERRLCSEGNSRDGARGFLSPRDKRCGGLRRVAPPDGWRGYGAGSNGSRWCYAVVNTGRGAHNPAYVKTARAP